MVYSFVWTWQSGSAVQRSVCLNILFCSWSMPVYISCFFSYFFSSFAFCFILKLLVLFLGSSTPDQAKSAPLLPPFFTSSDPSHSRGLQAHTHTHTPSHTHNSTGPFVLPCTVSTRPLGRNTEILVQGSLITCTNLYLEWTCMDSVFNLFIQ